jgi:hypothetical protein
MTSRMAYGFRASWNKKTVGQEASTAVGLSARVAVLLRLTLFHSFSFFRKVSTCLRVLVLWILSVDLLSF